MATNTVGANRATSTYNIDVHSFHRRYNRILVEIAKSQSSGISQLMPFDVTRINKYIDAIDNLLDFTVGQPLLDCPETGPTEMTLQANAPMPYLENESAYDIMQLIEIARDEIANSQSSRMPTNLNEFDHARQKAYLAKIRSKLAYISQSEPLDLPESSPMVAVSGAGNLGV